MNFQQVLQSMNSPATATGTGATAGNGLGGSTNSLSATLPGLGRFFFDGAGTIVGKQTDASGFGFSMGIGTYQVNDDCTARLTLSSGQSPNLRRFLVDVHDEYARHVGHADLLREAVDGLVGEDPPQS